jgi:hypothetical protein
MENLIGILLLATLIEGTITYIFGKTSETESRPWLKYVSLAFGVAAAIAYKIDILAATGLVSQWVIVGYIVSGLIIGRGANYVNDLVTLIKAKSTPAS